jgi:cell division protease FtsH
VHIRRVLLADDVRAERVAGLTAGFTGADLANLVNEAALVATRERAERVGMRHFTAAIERIVAGLEKKNRLLSPREREIVAHHEMGHAIVASSLPGTDAVHKVSIIPRGIGALGYTMQRPTEDRFLMTREELENKLAVLLGGRAAEHLVYGHLSTGASDDLARATDIGRSMVTRYAMVPELGNAAFERESSSLLSPDEVSRTPYSEETAREIDRATRSLVDRAFNRARAILDHNRRVMYDGAQELLERETLDEADLEKLFARLSLPPGECEDAAA